MRTFELLVICAVVPYLIWASFGNQLAVGVFRWLPFVAAGLAVIHLFVEGARLASERRVCARNSLVGDVSLVLLPPLPDPAHTHGDGMGRCRFPLGNDTCSGRGPLACLCICTSRWPLSSRIN
jgi:hypothetical protein